MNAKLDNSVPMLTYAKPIAAKGYGLMVMQVGLPEIAAL